MVNGHCDLTWHVGHHLRIHPTLLTDVYQEVGGGERPRGSDSGWLCLILLSEWEVISATLSVAVLWLVDSSLQLWCLIYEWSPLRNVKVNTTQSFSHIPFCFFSNLHAAFAREKTFWKTEEATVFVDAHVLLKFNSESLQGPKSRRRGVAGFPKIKPGLLSGPSP